MTTHPTGITSRPLPDGWPALDIDHGFMPPFSVGVWDCGSFETVAVFPAIHDAARKASWLARRHGVSHVEITDQRCRSI